MGLAYYIQGVGIAESADRFSARTRFAKEMSKMATSARSFPQNLRTGDEVFASFRSAPNSNKLFAEDGEGRVFVFFKEQFPHIKEHVRYRCTVVQPMTGTHLGKPITDAYYVEPHDEVPVSVPAPTVRARPTNPTFVSRPQFAKTA